MSNELETELDKAGKPVTAMCVDLLEAALIEPDKAAGYIKHVIELLRTCSICVEFEAGERCPICGHNDLVGGYCAAVVSVGNQRRLCGCRCLFHRKGTK